QDGIARVKQGHLFRKARAQLPRDVCSGRERIPQRACGTMIGKSGREEVGGRLSAASESRFSERIAAAASAVE
uniref:Uncharacterized protein n=1 Tax=Triticum urartu TaxID=4572 RepID=A0A8R7V1V4_TRIUA